jgi:hypothetical protein
MTAITASQAAATAHAPKGAEVQVRDFIIRAERAGGGGTMAAKNRHSLTLGNCQFRSAYPFGPA